MQSLSSTAGTFLRQRWIFCAQTKRRWWSTWNFDSVIPTYVVALPEIGYPVWTTVNSSMTGASSFFIWRSFGCAVPIMVFLLFIGFSSSFSVFRLLLASHCRKTCRQCISLSVFSVTSALHLGSSSSKSVFSVPLVGDVQNSLTDWCFNPASKRLSNSEPDNNQRHHAILLEVSQEFNLLVRESCSVRIVNRVYSTIEVATVPRKSWNIPGASYHTHFRCW